MDTLGDVVAPDRRSEALAYERPGDRSRSYSYNALCTDTWKAGNLMRHYGVREGVAVGVVDGPKDPEGDRSIRPIPESLLAVFGAAALGAPVRLDPPAEPDVRALVCPDHRRSDYTLAPGSKYLAYGGPPEDPTVAHFERELWSENPIQFPDPVDPDSVAVVDADGEYTHAALLSAAEGVVEAYGLTADDSVAIDTPLDDAGTLVAGVLAPLSVGGTITTGGDAALVVGEGDGENRIAPAAARP